MQVNRSLSASASQLTASVVEHTHSTVGEQPAAPQPQPPQQQPQQAATREPYSGDEGAGASGEAEEEEEEGEGGVASAHDESEEQEEKAEQPAAATAAAAPPPLAMTAVVVPTTAAGAHGMQQPAGSLGESLPLSRQHQAGALWEEDEVEGRVHQAGAGPGLAGAAPGGGEKEEAACGLSPFAAPPSQKSDLTDYGDLLHPHQFAVHLLEQDLGGGHAPPPEPSTSTGSPPDQLSKPAHGAYSPPGQHAPPSNFVSAAAQNGTTYLGGSNRAGGKRSSRPMSAPPTGVMLGAHHATFVSHGFATGATPKRGPFTNTNAGGAHTQRPGSAGPWGRSTVGFRAGESDGGDGMDVAQVIAASHALRDHRCGSAQAQQQFQAARPLISDDEGDEGVVEHIDGNDEGSDDNGAGGQGRGWECGGWGRAYSHGGLPHTSVQDFKPEQQCEMRAEPEVQALSANMKHGYSPCIGGVLLLTACRHAVPGESRAE